MLIEYPKPDFRIELRNNQPYIFDCIRRKWLLLQEEEWVRQNFVQYLIQIMKYPQPLIALEKEIALGTLKKRFDVLVYDANHNPWMLVECKGADVALTDATLQQVLRYNISMPALYLVITNGSTSYGWRKCNGSLEEISSLPEFGAHH